MSDDHVDRLIDCRFLWGALVIALQAGDDVGWLRGRLNRRARKAIWGATVRRFEEPA